MKEYTVPDDRLIQEATKAIEKLLGSAKHREIAREHVRLLTEDMAKLVEYYDNLRTSAPSTYISHVTSGKMSKTFRLIFKNNEQDSLDILTLTKYYAEKEIVRQAVAACQGNEALTTEETDTTAMHIMRKILTKSVVPRTVKSLAIKHAKNLLNNKHDDDVVDAEVDEMLSTNYLR